MSRVSYRARASASDSLSPASTLSRMCLDIALIGPALAHLFEDPLPRTRVLGEDGEEDGEGHALPLPVVQVDRPPVLLHDGVDDGEPQPRPLGLRCEEGVEDVVHHVVRYA